MTWQGGKNDGGNRSATTSPSRRPGLGAPGSSCSPGTRNHAESSIPQLVRRADRCALCLSPVRSGQGSGSQMETCHMRPDLLAPLPIGNGSTQQHHVSGGLQGTTGRSTESRRGVSGARRPEPATSRIGGLKAIAPRVPVPRPHRMKRAVHHRPCGTERGECQEDRGACRPRVSPICGVDRSPGPVVNPPVTRIVRSAGRWHSWRPKEQSPS
jgi:hypothetical protein